MERAKDERTVARRQFTISAKNLDSYVTSKNVILASAEFEKLSERYRKLQEINNRVLDLWLNTPDRDQSLFEHDLDVIDEYDTKWFILKAQYEKLNKEDTKSSNSSAKSTIKTAKSGECSTAYGKRHLRLPKLELPKFDGKISGWLAFWTQFKKIHNDVDIDSDDKFQYLRQCMEYGSTARDLVESFPPTGDNYLKAIEQLQQRFGRDELIIEYYVRELLQLVLAQSKGVPKCTIRSLYDKLMTQILALESLGVTQDKYAAFLYPLVESAVPEDILRAWSRSHMRTSEEESPLSQLLKFVKREVESDERIRLSRSGYDTRTEVELSTPTAACFANASKESKEVCSKAQPTAKPCIWCDKVSHASSECRKPIDMTLQERRDFIKQKNACSICLNPGHFYKKCKKFPKCLICNKRHHAIMCDKIPAVSPPEQNVLSQSVANQTVLLQTLKVNITDGSNVVRVRALLDSGAQRTFVKSDVVEKLRLKSIGKQELSHVLFGGGATKSRSHKLFKLNVKSLDGNYECSMEALEQGTICGTIPKLRQGSIVDRLQTLGISVSDCIDDNSDIGLLIGSDVSGALFTGRSVQLEDSLLAVETKLGWTVQGPAIGIYCSLGNVNTTTCHLDITDFWELETLGIRDQSERESQPQVNAEVLAFFKNTTKINVEGRYEIKLPWKDTAKLLQPNYKLALKRLQSTTSKLDKLGIIDEYDKVFVEWQESDIIEEVVNDDTSKGHYMPHHAVIRESSLTTRIRPVFDASALDFNGLSLNSCLERGVNLIELIPRLLAQFRKNAIGITADIKKAFLQISVDPNDRDYLKFLWWRDVHEIDKVIKVFRHRRVVFGVTTSPFLLSATLLYHLEQFDSDTATKLKKAFYVDNCVLSVKNVEEMNRFITEAKDIMMQGKFELRCWVTGPTMIDEEVADTSILGLMWDPRRDEIYCKKPTIKLKPEDKVTKRAVLSLAQSTFDPSGIACPTTIVPKLIMQKCWILNIDWNQELPKELTKLIQDWTLQLQCLEQCRMARRLSRNDLDHSQNSLHTFCDASQVAYAACIFLRSEYNGVVDVQLVTAKSRVAPTKSITVPRLELLATLIGTRLAAEAKEGLELHCKEYYWTDSSIALAWIRRQSGLNMFVHNRVKEIASLSKVNDWHHVPGELNPADLPSRGCNPEALLQSRWWEGPSWLKAPETEWPQSESPPDEEQVLKEVKRSCLMVSDKVKFSNQLEYFSKYSKIVRTVAWTKRFLFNCQKVKEHREYHELSAEEYENAEKSILKVLQTEDFSEPTDGTDIRTTFNLETFKDEEGLIRVKTRLTLGNDTQNFISPILLSGKSCIVERLVAQKHVENLHAGSQTLINKVRENYWVVNIRRLARKIVRQCVICRRYSAKPCTVPPAPLPVDRIQCGSVFEATGVDLAGPLYLKSGKCWIVLFTCATYRAVHLEVCTSLSTQDFLLALRRFLARRANVKVIYSDNATNFHGANNLFKTISWESIAVDTSIKKISWRFIPPSAPWWGGFWERLIKVLKEILRKVLGKAALELNEMVTVLCEVEAVMNARPLTYIATSSENFIALSPAMFLNVGSANENSTDLFDNIDGKILTARWRYLKKLKDELKLRFHSEYIALLAKNATSNQAMQLKVGDIVLIGSDDKKRLNWPLGIVVEIMPGADGHSRVAKVKTQGGYLVRAYQRLYPLEVPREWPVAVPNPEN